MIPYSVGAKSGLVSHIVDAPEGSTGKAVRELAETVGPLCGYKAQIWNASTFTLEEARKVGHRNHCNRCMQKQRQRESNPAPG